MIRRILASAAILTVFISCSSLCRTKEADSQRLLDAAKSGQLATVQSLVGQGVSPKVEDKDGRTPLHLAVSNGHQETAEALLRSGADINARDKEGRTPLHLAAGNGHNGTVEYLWRSGANVKAKGKDGRTPLHLAGGNGHQATSEALLRSGADINALDRAGKTPLDLAEAGGHSETAAFLVSKGARRGQIHPASESGPSPTPDREALAKHLTKGTPEHTAWLAKSLLELQAIKPGMTRKDLLTVFEGEGGLHTRTERRYAYRECPYIKVDVKFEAVGAPEGGRLESPKDKISSISTPFLEWSIYG